MKAKMTLNRIEEGNYRGKIINAFDNGTYGTAVVEIESDNSFHEIVMFVPSKINPRSSLAKFMSTVGIIPDSSNGEITMSDFVGYDVIVSVEDIVSKKDGNTYSTIKTIELDPNPVDSDVTDEELPF